jgi:pimeloyl-ACP methyl ester carboxylesterase
MPKLSRNGVNVSYQIQGRGQPILLIHGAASSARSFADCAPVLAEKRQVILPDLRGMGDSDRITSLRATDWVEDLIAVLDHLGVDTADVAGTSLGARIATRLALDHPDRVSSLIVDAPMVYASAAGEAQVNSTFGSSRDDTMARLLQSWHGPDWESVATTYLQLRQDPQLQEYLDLRDELHRVSTRLFITRGDVDDPIHPISHAVEYHMVTAAKSELWIAPCAGFSLARFLPKKWARAVDEFIWSLDMGSRAIEAQMRRTEK